jgi:ribose-phosphate pyrophosphokinase
MIIGGPASQLLAGKLATILNQRLALCDYKIFPDGEAYSQILTELDGNVIIIQSTPTDRDIIYLLQLLDICRGKNISLVIPYFGYSRQDKIFKHGEAITARALVKAIDHDLVKKSRVYLINIHAPSILDHFSTRAENLDATPLLANAVRGLGLQSPVVISPDKGAIAMARSAAACINAPYDYLQKTRLSGTDVSMTPKEIDVKSRDVVIFDDIISTGGTMASAATMLHKQGAKRVFLAAVHPVLAGSALIKLYHSGVTSVLATDTLDKAVGTISVAPLIAQALKQ